MCRLFFFSSINTNDNLISSCIPIFFGECVYCNTTTYVSLICIWRHSKFICTFFQFLPLRLYNPYVTICATIFYSIIRYTRLCFLVFHLIHLLPSFFIPERVDVFEMLPYYWQYSSMAFLVFVALPP